MQQTPRLFDLLTVAENLFIENPTVRSRWGAISHRRMIERASALGVVVSDEEEEISQLANRVVIVFERAVVDELVGDDSMKDLILRIEGVFAGPRADLSRF